MNTYENNDGKQVRQDGIFYHDKIACVEHPVYLCTNAQLTGAKDIGSLKTWHCSEQARAWILVHKSGVYWIDKIS